MIRQKIEQYHSPFMIRLVRRYGVMKTVPVILYGPNRVAKALHFNASVIADAIAKLKTSIYKNLVSKIKEVTDMVLTKPLKEYITYQKYFETLYEVRK